MITFIGLIITLTGLLWSLKISFIDVYDGSPMFYAILLIFAGSIMMIGGYYIDPILNEPVNLCCDSMCYGYCPDFNFSECLCEGGG